MPVDATATTESDRAEEVLNVHETRCCVVGGGPGGMMLALLLARRDVPVTLLEAHPTFERDFRGDSIHPGLLEILDEIGLADRLHERQHVKMYGPTLPGARPGELAFDFRRLLKITASHLQRDAYLYIRQSRTPKAPSGSARFASGRSLWVDPSNGSRSSIMTWDCRALRRPTGPAFSGW